MRTQVYLVTGTGISDTRSSHYTQFSGLLLRPSPETFRQAVRQAAQVIVTSTKPNQTFKMADTNDLDSIVPLHQSKLHKTSDNDDSLLNQVQYNNTKLN